ncbi:MAG: hypothetical protein ACF8Q5_08355 [Phycisphaerales bacterium JB040]
MTTRVAYLERDDRGGRLGGIRLVTESSDDHWDASAYKPHDFAIAAESGAEWIQGKDLSGPVRAIDTLCVDADGGACSWLSLPDTNPSTVRSMIESQGMPEGDDPYSEASAELTSGRFPDLPGELSLEPLAPSGPSGVATAPRSRTPVLAMPDATVRLMLDALDRRGIRVETVCSLWHAAARVWDPSSPLAHRGSFRGDRVVSTDAPVTAVVLIDPLAQRLVWSWSSAGDLLAAGSMRVRTAVDRDVQRLGLDTVGEIERRAVVTDAEIGRLAQDWLAWAAQTGLAPSRIVCVGSPSPLGDEGMTPARVGESLAARWHDASVDVVDEPDAVGLTLRRLASPEAAPIEGSHGTQLVALTRRPGSAHRSLFRWAGIALMVLGVGFVVVAMALFGRANRYSREIPALSGEFRDTIATVDPALAGDPFALTRLRETVANQRRALAPTNEQAPAPVAETFDTLSLVLGVPGIKLSSLSVSSVAVNFQVITPDLSTAEQLGVSLRSIGGLPLNWGTPTLDQVPNTGEIRASFNATWVQPPREASP